MSRTRTLIAAFCAFALAVAAVPFLMVFRQGINDAEYKSLVETGLPSSAEQIVWSPWSSEGLDEIFVLAGAAAAQPSLGKIVEARFGKCSNFFVSFGFYQAKVVNADGATTILPASGPKAWTTISLWPSTILAALGVVLLFMRRKSSQIDPDSPGESSASGESTPPLPSRSMSSS